MKQITSADGRQAIITDLLGPDDLILPFQCDAYVAMLWACVPFKQEQRRQIVTTLIRSGCRYIVCGGVGCERWHDDADDVREMDVHTDSSGERPFVMTTWHAGESEDEVVFFTLNCTDFEEHLFRKFLIVVVGCTPSRRNRIEQLVRHSLVCSDPTGSALGVE